MKIDLGCGKAKKPGFVGVDLIAFEGVDVVLDIGKARWPWEGGSVTEAHCSHFLEHLTAWERVHFANELDRVLAPGAACQLVVPHWASNRAYGDPTHQWPPVAEMWFFYLDRKWRAANAPHTDIEHNPLGFSCDLEATWGYSLHQSLQVRNQEYQSFALGNYKEAAQDIVASLRRRASA